MVVHGKSREAATDFCLPSLLPTGSPDLRRWDEDPPFQVWAKWGETNMELSVQYVTLLSKMLIDATNSIP
jgi:hypothetical protein